MNPLLLVALAYLLGATPTSHWVSRALHGVDLRTRGSGNLGATNVFRVLGWQAALPVVLVDVGKGFVPVWLFPRLDGEAAWAWTLAYGAATIVGHVISVWVKFKGGKGVATSSGVFLALAPWSLLAGFGVWVFLVLTLRIVSVASMSAAVTVAVVTWLVPPEEGGDALLAFTVVLALFVIWAHRSNIGRLLRGEENRFASSEGEGPPPDAESA